LRKTVVILVVAIALVFIIPYFVYATDYKGNYNVTATSSGTLDLAGTFSATTPTISSEPTSAWDFWDMLKSHTRPDARYSVFLEITRSGEVVGSDIAALALDLGGTGEVVLVAENVSPGQADVRVYFMDLITMTIVYDKTIQETIP
jgi:hypothetical protein